MPSKTVKKGGSLGHIYPPENAFGPHPFKIGRGENEAPYKNEFSRSHIPPNYIFETPIQQNGSFETT